MALLRLVAMVVVLLAVAGSVAHAQIPGLTVPGRPAETPPQAAPAAPPDVSGQARALIDVLRDDAARAALLAELERLATAGGAPVPAPTAETATPEAAPPSEPPTLGTTLAELTRELIADLRAQGQGFVNGLAATQRRLSLLWTRADNLIGLAKELFWVVLMTVVIYAVLRRLVRVLFRRAEAAVSEASIMRRAVLTATGAVFDLAAVVVSWAAGHVVSEIMHGNGDGALTQTLYLNAFLIVEAGKVAFTTVLEPQRPALRALPLSDGAARYWTRRIDLMTSVLGYGLMLAVPLVASSVSIFSARAVAVVIYAVVLLWAMALVLRHRRDPAAWVMHRLEANPGDASLRLLSIVAQIWHWPALAYLLSLFVLAVSASGTIEPLLLLSGKVLGVIVAGTLASSLLARTARKGITLPDSVREPLPLLETRLNGFLENLLGVLRLLITLITFGAALRVSGLFDVVALLERVMGRDFGTSLFSVLVVVVVAFMLWLALASWVDYRLNPSRAVPATAREATLLTLFRNAVTIALVVITLMISLSELGLDIAPLLASAGVLGLAIGFGSQRLVQDIITGIFIQFENAINVGDVVTVGGTTGSVEKLTIRSVSLRDVNGVFHIIPFSAVDRVSNFMRDFSFHVADIGIAYRESTDEAKALMFKAFDDLKAMPEFSRVIIGPLDWHGVTTLGDSAVTLRARIRTRPGSQWAVGRAYNEAVKRRFDEAGVEIPFPHMTVWFGESKDGRAPPLHMTADIQRTPQAGEASPRKPISTTPFGQDAPNKREDDDDDGDDDPR